MNYRHAFHAGNHADVLKHLALVFCLDALKRKPAAFAALDTHAGRALYDFGGAEAQRSPEWRKGIDKLWDWSNPPRAVAGYLDAVRTFNSDAILRQYPGSPALIAAALRADDRLIACELHPEENAALQRARLPGRVEIHQRDGYEAMLALTPFPERRGLILIDPPYEQAGELVAAARTLARTLARFGHASVLWWRPLKHAAELAAADAELARPGLRADLWIDRPLAEGRLLGSSLFAVNPPWGLEAALAEALPALAERLGIGAAAGWRLQGQGH